MPSTNLSKTSPTTNSAGSITITKLSSTKRRDAVNLYIEGQYIAAITVDTVLAFNLSKSKTITNHQLNELIIYSTNQKLLQQAVNYISIRIRSQFEINLYLKQIIYKLSQSSKISELANHIIQSNSQNLINQTIKKLEENNYIDDYQFARQWVESRLRSKPRGAQLLKLELKNKGIASEIIQQVLQETLTENNDLNNQMIDQVIQKALKSLRYKNLAPEKLKQILIQRIISKGFSYKNAKNKIDESLVNEYNDNH